MAVIIEQGNGYTIASFGNGAAYSVRCERTGRETFIQYGDAAAAFRKTYDALDECDDPRMRKHVLNVICSNILD